jgi:hypothetical protein
MVGLGRVELPTYGLGNRRSIQLSYSPAHLFIHDGQSVANAVTKSCSGLTLWIEVPEGRHNVAHRGSGGGK